MKNLITSLKFIAKASLFVFAFVLFSQTADAAFKLNDGGQALCKDVVRVTKNDPTVYDPNTFGSEYLSQSGLSAGDYVYVSAFGANIGASSGSVSFNSDVFQSAASNNHTIHVTVGNTTKNVSIGISGSAQTLQLDAVNTGNRIKREDTSNPVNPTLVYSYTGYNTSVSQNSTSWSAALSQISGFGTTITGCGGRGVWNHAPIVPQNNSGYEKVIIWRYKVGSTSQPQGNPPVVSNINPSGTVQNPTSLTWNATNNPTSCVATYSNGLGSYSDNTSPYSITTPSTNPGYYSGSVTCTNQYGSDTQPFSYTIQQPQQNPPVVTANANTSNVSWSATNNPTSCTLTYTTSPWTSNTYPYPSTMSVASQTAPGTYSGYVTCTNGLTSNQDPFSYTVAPQNTPVTVDLKVNGGNSANTVSGQLALLTWTSSNATICTSTNIAGGNIGTQNTNPGISKYPTSSTTYNITCTNPATGQQGYDSVAVTVNQQNTPASLATTFSVTGSNGQTQTSPNTTPITITQGQSATLSYSVLAQNGGAGATLGCQRPISTGGGWNSPLTSNTGGTVTQSLGVQNTVGTKTYSLNCTFSGITSNRQVTVIVNQAAATPIGIDLRVNGQNGPLSVTAGTPLVLNWNPVAGSGPIGSNACTLSWAGGSYGGTGSTPSFGAVSTQTYTVTCTAAGVPNAVDSVTVNVGSAPTPAVTLLSVSPNPATPGSTVFISYSSQNTTACQLYVKVPGATSFYPVGASNLPTNGTTSFVIPATPTTGVYTFKVICNGASSGTQSINVQPSNGNPVITTGLSATGTNGQTAVSPNTLTVTQGQSVTLTYYVNGTGGSNGSNPICTASVVGGGYWTYGISANTSASSVALGVQNTVGSKTYKLDCTYSGITATSKQVTVTVTSGVSANVYASANPTSVQTGNQSTISWNGTGVNLSNCFVQKRTPLFTWNTVISNVSSGQQVTPSNGTNTYRVGCYATNGGGVIYSNQVVVTASNSNNNLLVGLTANGQNPSYNSTSGQQVNLQWNVTGASYPTCTRSWISGTTNSTSGFTYVYPTQTTTYTITCQSTSTSNGGYPVSDTVTVYINGNGNQLEVVTDNNVDNVTDDSARIYGNLVDDGAGNVTLWFEVTTSSNPICSYSNSSNEYLSQTGVNGSTPFYKTVSGLNQDETYYYRACAMDNNGVVDSGAIYNFTTDDNVGGSGSFSISTLSPENVDENGATFRGEVNDEDNVDVWFAYSSSDSSPECSGNDSETYLSSNYDDGDSFEKDISGLQTNRTYYYRACGEKNGDTEEGSVRSFQTDTDNGGPINNGGSLPIITTLFPGSIGFDSANLQATVNANGCDTTTWFKYSTAAALSQPQQTAPRQQGNVSGVINDSATNLLPGVTYYVTAYAQNCRGTVSGGTVSFKTVGQTSIDYGNYDYNTNTTTQTVVQYIGGGSGADWLKLDIDDNSTTTTVGQTSQYKVTWENLTNSTLKSGKISVIFPKQLQVIATSEGQITSDGSVINEIGDIQGNKTTTGTYKGEFVVTTRARSIAAGTAVVAQAIAAFDTPKSDAQVNAIDYDQNTVFNNGLFGAAAFGSGPFGLGVIGWVLLLLAILLIFLIARYAAMSRTGYYQPQPMMMHNPYPPQQLYYQQPPQPMYTQPMMYTQQAAPTPAPTVVQQVANPVADLPTEDAVEGYEYKPYRPTYPQE